MDRTVMAISTSLRKLNPSVANTYLYHAHERAVINAGARVNIEEANAIAKRMREKANV